jgi:hypothetical protein
MTRVSQAEFARLCGYLRKTVTLWKQRGLLVTQGGQVDIEASVQRMERLRRSGSPVPSRVAGSGGEGANQGNTEGNAKTNAGTAAQAVRRILADGAQAGVSLAEALRIKTNYLALLRKLEYKRRSGALTEMAVAQNVVFEICREQRDAWLAWPAKVAPFIAMQFGIDDVDRLTAALSQHVHQQLVGLAGTDADLATG